MAESLALFPDSIKNLPGRDESRQDGQHKHPGPDQAGPVSPGVFRNSQCHSLTDDGQIHKKEEQNQHGQQDCDAFQANGLTIPRKKSNVNKNLSKNNKFE